MSIQAPTWTQVPNEIFLLMPDMEKSELKVVLAICRMTIGWHKEKDRLTITRLMDLTGLSRQSVYDGIEAGKARGLVVQEETKEDGYIYSLDIEVSNGETPKIYSLDAKDVQPLDTQKKESLQKKVAKESEPPAPAPDNDFQRVWKDVETLFPIVNPTQFMQFRDLWEKTPQFERHAYAFGRAQSANPRSFKFYLTDFASYNPDVPRTWGKEMVPSAVAALPAGSVVAEAPPAHLTALAGMALPNEPLEQELVRLKAEGRIKEETYHASVKRYCAGVGGERTAAQLLAGASP